MFVADEIVLAEEEKAAAAEAAAVLSLSIHAVSYRSACLVFTLLHLVDVALSLA